MTEPIEIEMSDEEYVAYLDEIYPPVSVCGMEMSPGRILMHLDQPAFDGGKPDRWACGNYQKEYEEESDAKECCNETCVECFNDYDPADSNASEWGHDDDKYRYCSKECLEAAKEELEDDEDDD